MPHLHVENIAYSYPGGGADKVFEKVSFSVEKGETLHLVGRNGSGKTTLLKVVAGIYEPTQGSIHLNGDGIIALMDQDSGNALSLELTIREHLHAFNINSTALDFGRAILSRFGLGLEHRMDEFVGHLSGGQRQIVALTTALARQPSVLCLDEFTASLDLHSAKVAETIIDELLEANRACLLLVSHRALEREQEARYCL